MESYALTIKGKKVSNKEFINYSICKNHTGKMENLLSISTSCKCNTICAERAKNRNSICYHCYAQKQLSYQHTTNDKLTANYNFYTNVELTDSDIPFINAAFFRFESFGDLQNIRQFENYCIIARNNKHCHFVLWTKNVHIIKQYIDSGYNAIPDNLYIIVSSPFLNHCIRIDELTELDYIGFVDAVFSVYDEDTIASENININCGGRKCSECLRCYTLNHNKITFINEKLK